MYIIFMICMESQKEKAIYKFQYICAPHGAGNILLLLLLLFKPAAQAQVRKIKSFINCFRYPTSTCAMEN